MMLMLTDIILSKGGVEIYYSDVTWTTRFSRVSEFWEYFAREECTPEFFETVRRLLMPRFDPRYLVNRVEDVNVD